MIRHAKNIEIRNLEATSIAPDPRPFMWFSDVDRIEFSGLIASGRRTGTTDARDVQLANIKEPGAF